MEAVGSASAIIGIATTGIQCSIKLLTFADQIKSAPAEITNIAEDISVNASTLQQLGGLADKTLFHTQAATDTNTNNSISNGNARTVNPEAIDYSDTEGHEPQNGIFNAAGFAIVMNLASKCNAIFERLEEGLRKASKQLRANPQSKDPIRLSPAEMVKWPFFKPQMDAMRAELRDAKGTLMLMLQVAMLRYSKKVMEGWHATRTSLIAYSEEDQYLLKRSIVAAERARIDIAKHRDDTLAGNRTASVTERDTVDENFQSLEMTTTVAVPVQLRRPHNLGNDTSRGMPQVPPVEVKNLNCQPRRDIGFCSAHTDPSDPNKVNATDGEIASISLASDASLGVYILIPKVQIRHGKPHVEYQVRSVKVPRQGIDSQIDQWKNSSNRTVLNQLLALSADEQQALDALNIDGGHGNITDADAIEFIHFGELFPVDGFDDIRARRSITFIMRLKHPSTTAEERETKSQVPEIQEDITIEARVPRHRVSPESLSAYGLPWRWDESDYDYVVVDRSMFNHFQEDLLAHTRRLGVHSYIAAIGDSLLEGGVIYHKRHRRSGLLFQLGKLSRAIGSKLKPKLKPDTTLLPPARVEEEVNLDRTSHGQVLENGIGSSLNEPQFHVIWEEVDPNACSMPSISETCYTRRHPPVPVVTGSMNGEQESSEEEVEGIVRELLDRYTAA
ncbi:uncharacterized protein BO87DRAFT_436587 [Aspergillus neoniger CBS 115656]|uniref:Fungal N-terminal domain-containing protein n=1 Tax=Aspergillus neoniger (strain CBS 115656) TaxID=1448310 RepID=A0A318YHK6_ASPNB|nr:hypothetical protein BO87DRAFT_436587 [Aspergillus neoniger CBS 115656]PYH33991.1 hypothetical protein BO87DRAFT_436587 [Aspergillus neoniger CBS 115656]